MKEVIGTWISLCTGHMGRWGRSKHTPACESSEWSWRAFKWWAAFGLNSLLLIRAGLWMREYFMEPYANAALDRLLLMLEMKANAPKTSIFVDVSFSMLFWEHEKARIFLVLWLSCYFESSGFFFPPQNKQIRGIQGFVQLWSLSFQDSVWLKFWLREAFIRFVQEASCSFKS